MSNTLLQGILIEEPILKVPKKAKKKSGRPKKKRRTDPTAFPVAMVSSVSRERLSEPALLRVDREEKKEPIGPTRQFLLQQRAELERQISDIKHDLRNVDIRLYEKQVELGLPVTVELPLPLPQVDEDASNDADWKATAVPRSKASKKSKAKTLRKTNKKSNTNAAPRRSRASLGTDPILLPEFSYCRDVVDQLIKHRFGGPFRIPVDPIRLGVPDYFKVIQRPMDLGTIRQKLINNQYTEPSDFIEEVNLVFDNACTFNSPASEVFIMAETLKRSFGDKIKTLTQRITPGQTDTGGFRGIKESVDTMREEIRTIIGKKTQDVAAPSRQVSSQQKDAMPLTKDEKRQLSSAVSTLPAEHIAVIVKMIKDKLPLDTKEKEFVIDIDSLDIPTLRAMMRFVEQSTQKKRSKSSKRSRSQRSSKPAVPAPQIPPVDGTVKAEEENSQLSESDSESQSASEESESASESDSEPAGQSKSLLLDHE